jgi:hypothetical protein
VVYELRVGGRKNQERKDDSGSALWAHGMWPHVEQKERGLRFLLMEKWFLCILTQLTLDTYGEA